MTIGGWFGFGFLALGIIGIVIAIIGLNNFKAGGIASIIISGVIVIALMLAGFRWYYSSTASGIRALTDQKAELNNGLERTINVYTANGDLIATYSGKIDLEDNQGGYVLFEFNGKRYTYYNCFVESIANVD